MGSNLGEVGEEQTVFLHCFLGAALDVPKKTTVERSFSFMLSVGLLP